MITRSDRQSFAQVAAQAGRVLAGRDVARRQRRHLSLTSIRSGATSHPDGEAAPAPGSASSYRRPGLIDLLPIDATPAAVSVRDG